MTPPWRRFLIAPGLIEATEEALKSFNTKKKANEGFVYWAGRNAGKDCIALSLYKPRAVVTPGSVAIDEDENTRFVSWLKQNELTHVGQVHTHPPGVDEHSIGDAHWAFMRFPGLLSIVVPNYGKQGMRPLRTCDFDVFTANGFEDLTPADVRERVLILPRGGPT